MFKIIIFALLLFLLSYGATIPDVQQWVGRSNGGVPINIFRHAYQVSLEYFGRHRCGGAILSNVWVVTSAQCTQLTVSSPTEAFTIRVGSSNVEDGGNVYPVHRIETHPKYGVSSNDNQFDYDISLIHVGRSILYYFDIQPVALPLSNQTEIPGAPCIITGWGPLWQDGPTSRHLQEVITPWISNESCNQYYRSSTVKTLANITSTMMCSGNPFASRDACQAESGAPLIVDRVLMGISSFGPGCDQRNFPNVFVYVVSLRDWITEVTGV